MLCERASSALRDGRHRPSYRLVGAWQCGSASPAAQLTPRSPPHSAVHPAARSGAPVSTRSSSSASARRIRPCPLIITGRLRLEYAGPLWVPALKPPASACLLSSTEAMRRRLRHCHSSCVCSRPRGATPLPSPRLRPLGDPTSPCSAGIKSWPSLPVIAWDGLPCLDPAAPRLLTPMPREGHLCSPQSQQACEQPTRCTPELIPALRQSSYSACRAFVRPSSQDLSDAPFYLLQSTVKTRPAS